MIHRFYVFLKIFNSRRKTIYEKNYDSLLHVVFTFNFAE